MKRYIFTILLLAGYSMFNVQCSMALAQPRFVPDTDIKKVGEVEFQVPRHFSLGFTNKGDKPLLIKEVKASCGCIDVSFPKAPKVLSFSLSSVRRIVPALPAGMSSGKYSAER